MGIWPGDTDSACSARREREDSVSEAGGDHDDGCECFSSLIKNFEAFFSCPRGGLSIALHGHGDGDGGATMVRCALGCVQEANSSPIEPVHGCIGGGMAAISSESLSLVVRKA